MEAKSEPYEISCGDVQKVLEPRSSAAQSTATMTRLTILSTWRSGSSDHVRSRLTFV